MAEFLPFTRPAITEEDILAVTNVLRSGWITTGPQTAALEEAFCQLTGAQQAVALCSATAAMHLVLLALNIGPGDEVITPSLTWVSTANMIVLCGATPVFVDVDKDTLLIDCAEVERKITPRTKAIIPVHYAGAPADLHRLRALAAKHQITLIEDAAHAVGTRYFDQPIGCQGTAIFSLHAIKNITSAEGGMLVTDDSQLADKVRQLRFHGLAVDAFDRSQHGRKPQAEVQVPGFKYNLADLNAVLALSQIKHLTAINQKRAQLSQCYQQLISERGIAVDPLIVPDYSHQHAYHLFIVRALPEKTGIDRNTLMQCLKEHDIGSGIHFLPIHRQSYYKNQYFAQVDLPNTEYNGERILSLPLFPAMEKADVLRVVNALADCLEN